MSRTELSLRAVLDARTAEAALRDPFLDSVNIPLEELPGRTHELPAATVLLQVADCGSAGEEAVAWLLAHGRRAVLCTPETGPAEAAGRLWSPSQFLEEVVADQEPGHALDLGCGTGRDAVYLASLGWKVGAIDVLPDAIERARALEARYPFLAGRVHWVVADVSQGLSERGPLDLVTMFSFLDRAALADAAERVSPGGLVIVETFSPLHRERFGKPHSANLTLGLGEALGLLPRMSIRHLDADWRAGGRHTVRVVWQKA